MRATDRGVAILAALLLAGCSMRPDRGRAAGGGSGGGAAGAVGEAGAGGGGGAGGMVPDGPYVPPDLGPNVLVFDPSMATDAIQTRLDGIYAQQSGNQFGTERWAFLFQPGQYALSVKVGYYTQVLGLGSSPDDVVIAGTVRSSGNSSGNATLSFWRACENLSITPPSGQLEMWAVSQGAALRRVHVRGPITLADSGNSSGGFLADAKIDGQVSSGSQQQYFSRNTQWGSWSGGVWNMVFVGTVMPPAGAWPGAPYSVADRTPLIAEKPYLFVDAAAHYAVMVPPLRNDSSGPGWTDPAAPPGEVVPIGRFYVAHAGQDDAPSLNAALAAGKHLLFTPGIYHLAASLQVTRARTIVLGLGMATLVADGGGSAITVADVGGVRIAGVLVDAGAAGTATLVQVGTPGAVRQDHAQDPTVLHDLFCRVGGGSAGTAPSCATIDSNAVVGDNLWLWRADHGAGAGWTQNRSATGLIVDGDDVTMYGLFVEHFQQYQTIWNGERGRLFFFQSEMPYDPPDQPSWQHGGVNGYAAYKVADGVTRHDALGLGVYSAFRAAVVADDALEAPAAPGVALHHLVTVWLNGAAGSAINHILNATGAAANQANRRANSAD